MAEIADLLKPDSKGLTPGKALASPVGVLEGISDAAAAVLAELSLGSVFDLAQSQLFSNALRIAGTGKYPPDPTLVAFGRAPTEMLDRDAEETPLAKVAEAPIIVLEGIGAKNSPAITRALDTVRVRDLAAWPPYLAARTILEAWRQATGTRTDRDELLRLAEENQRLRQQLDKARTVPQDDFAGALGHSLDQLQARLAASTNAVSHFAVRDFTLDTKVLVSINPLGGLSYRFPASDETVQDSALSRLSVQLVPIPRADATGSFGADLFDVGRTVADLPGLAPSDVATLRANGIDTLSDFLAAGTRARSATALAAALKVDRDLIATWVEDARLLAIRGIAPIEIEDLKAAGVRTITDLARLDGDQVVEKIKLGSGGVRELAKAQTERLLLAARRLTGIEPSNTGE